MKKLLIISSLIISSIISFVYAMSGSQQYVVISHKTPYFRNFAETTPIGTLDIGTAFVAQSQKGVRVQFVYQDEEIWVEQKNLALANFSIDTFSDSSILFVDLPILDDKIFCFVYDKQLYQLDIQNLPEYGLKRQTKLPNFSQISAANNRQLFLLIGETQKNNKNIINLAFYDIKNKKFHPLTFFDSDKVTINSVEFSVDNKYLSIYFSMGDQNMLHIYDVVTKNLIAHEKDVLNMAWFNTGLFIFTANKIYYHNIAEKKKSELYSFSRKISEAPATSVLAGMYLIQIQDTIYQFNRDNLQATTYKSLDRSPNGDLVLYTQKKQTIAEYQGTRIRALSGQRPQWSFFSILDNRRLLYRQQKDAIQILNMYDAKENKSYPFYWIEEPFYTLKNGTSFEYIIENQYVWIFVEAPGSWVRKIAIHQMVN